MQSCKLDFVIAGVQKCGTTALAKLLDQHPEISLPPTKELHHFNRPLKGTGLVPDKPTPRSDIHIAPHFGENWSKNICGDATPAYLYWPGSLELIKDYNPDIKLIVSLRHPVLRAFSAWSMEVRRKRETLSFSQAIREGRKRVSDAPFGVHKIYSYVERGFYSKQIKNMLRLFDSKQIFFIRSDNVSYNSLELMALVKFLNAKKYTFTALEGNIFPSSFEINIDLHADFQYLFELYEQDLQELSNLTPINIDDWKSIDSIIN